MGGARGTSADPTQALREVLVEILQARGALHDARVAEAFRAVPRHLFLPEVDAEHAYRDDAVPTKYDLDGRAISSSSQPAIMAVMLEQLDVRPGHRVLEVGAGTGYNAALLAHLAGDTGSVTTVDLDADIVAGARRHLGAADADAVRVLQGDGGLGAPTGAPYDRIMVTVGAWDIPPAWTGQLAPDGRLVLPLDLRGVQRSIAFRAGPEGRLESVSVEPCGFMRMRGDFAGPEVAHLLEPHVHLELVEPRTVDLPALRDALGEPGADIVSGVRVTGRDLWGGLGLWLALHEPDLARLSATGPAAERGLVPTLIARPGQAHTVALTGRRSLAVLVRSEHGQEPFELSCRPLGRDAEPLAARLVDHVRAWAAAGAPRELLHVSAYPPGRVPARSAGTVIHKRHRDLVVST